MSQAFSDSQVLDLAYLSRQTAGENELERELLALFEAQCARLRPLIAGDGPAMQRADAAHTLRGSARAVGAWRLASQTEALETALGKGEAEGALQAFMAALEEVLQATRQALARPSRAGAA